MPRYISDEILDKTNCPFSFQCLNEENIDICPVDRCLSGNFSFLKTVKPNHCAYQMEFGNSQICICPVRAELFRHYRI
jgi:hypothetical protein